MVVLRGGLTALGVPFIDSHDHQSEKLSVKGQLQAAVSALRVV